MIKYIKNLKEECGIYSPSMLIIDGENEYPIILPEVIDKEEAEKMINKVLKQLKKKYPDIEEIQLEEM